jgi:hypothetical protein
VYNYLERRLTGFKHHYDNRQFKSEKNRWYLSYTTNHGLAGKLWILAVVISESNKGGKKEQVWNIKRKGDEEQSNEWWIIHNLK